MAGDEIWVFSTDSKQRLLRLNPEPGISHVAVSFDDAPILAAATEGPEIILYDALTGEQTGSIEAPLLGAGILQFPELASGGEQ